MNLGEQIRKRRSELNMTQEELAEKLSVTRSAVSNWETEKNYPDLQTILDISDELNISLDILLKGDRKMVERITQDTNENPKLKMRIKGLIATIVCLCVVVVIGVLAYLYMSDESYLSCNEAGIRVTVDGDMHVDKPFYRSYGMMVGDHNETEIIFLTESRGLNVESKEIVECFNDNNIESVYYLPEKYIKKFDMLETKYIEFFPTKNELEDIMKADNLVWECN